MSLQHFKWKLIEFSGTKTLTDQPYNQNEDIIELQDVRLSPIASIRSRHNPKSNTCGEIDPSKFPPSFRITRSAHIPNHRPGLRFRGARGEFFIICTLTIKQNVIPLLWLSLTVLVNFYQFFQEIRSTNRRCYTLLRKAHPRWKLQCRKLKMSMWSISILGLFFQWRSWRSTPGIGCFISSSEKLY